DLVCAVEEPAVLTAEIKLPEQDLEDVQPGQKVVLKIRALPLDTFEGVVERLAPAAVTTQNEPQGTVTVYCRFDNPAPGLRSGLTGHARVVIGKQVVGRMVLDKALRLLRTEFWW